VSRYLARLVKLEASIPLAQPEAVGGRQPVDFAKVIAKIEAETARVAALPPKAKISHLQCKIAETTALAASPPPADPPGSVPGLAERFHALHRQAVKSGFPMEYYEIRRCEIQLLHEAGYDVGELVRQHRRWADLPWQWLPSGERLPADAQALIDDFLFDA